MMRASKLLKVPNKGELGQSLSRLLRLRGNLSPKATVQLNQALLIALDLPEQASYS